MQKIPIGPILIFIAALLWGLDGILRRSLFDLPPITIVFFEHLIGFIIMAPFFLKAWRAKTSGQAGSSPDASRSEVFRGEKLTNREWGVMGLIALFSGVLGTLFFTTALLKVNFISFSVVFLLQKLQPIFAVITAWFVLGERITSRYALWAALALASGYFVTFPNGIVNFAEGGQHAIAAGFALLAAILWGSSTAFSRYALLKHSHTFITGLRFLLTVPIALVFVFALGAAPTLAVVTPLQFGTLTLIALSTGAVALWIYYRGLKTTPASVSTIVELAFPMTAIFIDYFLYDTVLTAGQYIAAAVLLFAMYNVASLSKRWSQ